ncbi:MAG: hypothetical protein ACLTXL_10045 [Clostridia bacterium]
MYCSYDGTTDGSMVSFGTPQFTDGTNTFELTEGTDFTAKKASILRTRVIIPSL